MFIVFNLIVIVFILATMIVWSKYGLFSSLLHLVLVILSGVIAFAFWEKVALGLLAEAMPYYAWGVGLLLPFGVLLLVLHVLVDRIAGMNVQVDDLVNLLGGGALGGVAGVLTAGMLILGLSFLPLPASLMGYQPYTINPQTGDIDHANRNPLWVPVDNWTAGFFTTLSGGSMVWSTPMATHQPDLFTQSALFRLRPDENSSTVAVPGSAGVSKMYIQPVATAGLTGEAAGMLGSKLNRGGSLVVLETQWEDTPKGTYDVGDSTLRLAATQVRLVVEDADGQASLVAPIAMRGRTDQDHKRPYLFLVDLDQSTAFSNNQRETIGLVFVIPEGQTPTFLLARHLRLSLPEADTQDAAGLRDALGGPAPEVKDDPTEGPGPGVPLADRDKITDPLSQAKLGLEGVFLEVTDKLPRPISSGDATSLSLRLSDSKEGGSVEGGKQLVKKAGGFQRGTKRRVSRIENAGHYATIRIKIVRDQVNTLFAAARQSAGLLNPIFIEDDQGNRRQPFAYVWYQAVDDSQYIHVLQGETFRSASQIENIGKLRKGDSIYLYFRVNKGVRLTSFTLGNKVQNQEIDFVVPDE